MYTCMGGAGARLLLRCEGGRLRKAAECSGMLLDVAAEQRGQRTMERKTADLPRRNRQASGSSRAHAPPMLPLTLEVL